MKVLIADDSALISIRIMDLIESIPGATTVARTTSVSDSIAAIMEFHPNVVILDMNLKDGSGMQVLEYIRRTGNQAKVIVLSEYSYSQYRKHSEQMGADYYLDKATEFGRLEEVLNEIKRAKLC